MPTRVALVVLLALAGTAVGFSEEEGTISEVPTEVVEICGDTAPVLADDEEFATRTLYFHGEHPVGNPSQVAAFPLNYAPEKTMDAEPPTGEDHKYDVVTAGTNPAFAGNPLSAYWRATLVDFPRVVCARTVFFGRFAGNIDVRLYADKGSADVNPNAVTAAQVTDDATPFAGLEAAFGAVDLGNVYQLVVQISHNDQFTPTDSGIVAYDSAVVPSRLELVTVRQIPQVVGSSPTG